MKIRHLFVFVMVLALATLGTSCNKDSEKKFYGKWNLTQMQYRDSDNEDWTDSINGSENMSIEFSDDRTFTLYDDVAEETGRWEYKDDYLYFHFQDEVTNIAFEVQECSKKNMEWFARREKWHEGEMTYWREERWNWSK